ncbi:uncharacterized protein EI97DRAFT_367135 [Westerdykella ornata]|uniref:CCZ1/INTU/HSP4 first Longin domain-containing protein n=1 Tax=Westerdykella ornata TaxID=318751 RepID=A0A6A6JZS4_WESOR|nr:uncharacterized protein EI97DRAFT_367135 [Westerdykella ornata]KAF2280579.1 hypothetical protein EI97DRAFT_367135 [Westerdykella ornata]
MSSSTAPRVIPAKLSFLAIYNPSLGATDETIQDQIVFYYSRTTKVRGKVEVQNPRNAEDLREELNEKLRQVGLAQGMVGFARSFSHGDAVNSVETEKSRIVLHELESGWWILAVDHTESIQSIDLTQLPAPATHDLKTDDGSVKSSNYAIEYSSREVSPPALLLQQLIRAHSIFLLHHGESLQSIFDKLGRTKFCSALERYWAKFAGFWDVLLHGSPAVDIFRGLKLAAGGELGVGVGEEDWGSGEREVLEDFARRTEGLVDIIVSRFGEPSLEQSQNGRENKRTEELDVTELEPWLGGGKYVNAGDGVVFSGIRALSRRSLRDVSHWMEDIYTYGEQAYGVKERPTADRRKRRRRKPDTLPAAEVSRSESRGAHSPGPATSPGETTLPLGIPPPIIKAVETSLNKATKAIDPSQGSEQDTPAATSSPADTEGWMKYLTLGYGTAWGGKGPHIGEQPPASAYPAKHDPVPKSDKTMRYVEPKPDVDWVQERLKQQIWQENTGYYVIGLKGDVEEEGVDEDSEADERVMLRTVNVELVDALPSTPDGDGGTPIVDKELTPAAPAGPRLSRLRAVVYAHRPFIYTFLFRPQTESLTLSTFYRNLHQYFSPLHRPLSNSTSPDKVGARLSAAFNPFTTVSTAAGSGENPQPIYNVVFDPRTLTVHSSLPNIPEPGTLFAEGFSGPGGVVGWSRAEALNVHSQILATVGGTRRTFSEIERTCKTSRGWWVVWLRLAPSAMDRLTDVQAQGETEAGFTVEELREAFLVRRSNDATTSSSKTSGSSGLWRLGRPSTTEKMGRAAAGWRPGGLAEGIGIDPRKYVESLLSLSR